MLTFTNTSGMFFGGVGGSCTRVLDKVYWVTLTSYIAPSVTNYPFT